MLNKIKMTFIAFINLKHDINDYLIIDKNSFVKLLQLIFTNSNQVQNNFD